MCFLRVLSLLLDSPSSLSEPESLLDVREMESWSMREAEGRVAVEDKKAAVEWEAADEGRVYRPEGDSAPGISEVGCMVEALLAREAMDGASEPVSVRLDSCRRALLDNGSPLLLVVLLMVLVRGSDGSPLAGCCDESEEEADCSSGADAW